MDFFNKFIDQECDIYYKELCIIEHKFGIGSKEYWDKKARNRGPKGSLVRHRAENLYMYLSEHDLDIQEYFNGRVKVMKALEERVRLIESGKAADMAFEIERR